MSATSNSIVNLPDQATAIVPKKNYITAEHGLLSWLLTGDHKRIAMLYLISITFFFFIGGAFAGLIRLELLTPLPDLVASDTYNKLFTMHGVIMIFLFLVPSVPATILINHAVIGSGVADADTATVVQSSPTLALAMTASPDPVRPGEQINYVITAINRGTTTMNGVKLRHVLPAWMVSTYQGFGPWPWESWTGPNSWLDSGEIVTWNLGTLAPGQSRSVIFAAQVSYGNSAPPDECCHR